MPVVEKLADIFIPVRPACCPHVSSLQAVSPKKTLIGPAPSGRNHEQGKQLTKVWGMAINMGLDGEYYELPNGDLHTSKG